MIVGNCWELGRHLASGTNGAVYKAINRSNGREAILKLDKEGCSSVRYEAEVYAKLKSGKGIPRMYDCGKHNNQYYLALERLGKDIKTLFKENGGRLGRTNALIICKQLLHRLELLHSAGYVHRVLHLGNIMIGRKGNEATIFLIDLGDAKRYVDSRGRHVPKRDSNSVIGMVAFSSRSVLEGYTYSRRDDLESLLYLTVYLARGSLPWMSQSDSVSQTLKEMKRTCSADITHSFPRPFVRMAQTIRSLHFDERPSYSSLRKLVEDSLREMGHSSHSKPSWVR